MKKVLYGILFFGICFASHYVHATATISGTVTDATTGRSISGALVEAARGNTVRYSTNTVGDGTYTLANVQPSNYTLIVSASGYQAQSVGVNPKNNQITTVNIALIPHGGTLSGTVTNALTTLPIAGAVVTIFEGTTFITSTTTDGSGFYSVPNPSSAIFLAPGNYIVLVRATGFDADTQGAQVQAGVTTTVNFALSEPPGTISGTVTDSSSAPIPGALIEVYAGSIVVGFADTDAGGSYTIPDLAPGSYTVVVTASNYQSQTVGAIVTASMTTTVTFILELNPGSIIGTVTDVSTGKPLPGATIAIFQGVTLIETVLTDPDGNYSSSDLAPGNYIVVANATKYEISTIGAIVTSNHTTTANFALTPRPGTIVGTVVDAGTHNSIAGVTVEVFDNVIVIATVLTNSSGNYQITDLAPGSYTVVANKKNYQIQTAVAAVTSNSLTTIDFALVSNPGEIFGTVTDASTLNPIQNTTVLVFQAMTLISSTLTDSNGAYVISDLAPGTYFVVAIAQNHQAAFSTAVVTAGSPTPADFELNLAPGSITGTITDACAGNAVGGALVLVTSGQVIVGFGLSDSNGVYDIPDLAPGTYTVTIIKKNFVTNNATALVVSNVTTRVNFVLIPVALPPTTLVGSLICDTYLTHTDYIHVITWTASPSSCVTGYKIFRNGIQIAFVSSSTLKYVDCRCNNKMTEYAVQTVTSLGQISDSVSITIGCSG